MEIADILERAADPIEPEGAWTQGRFGSRAQGGYCIIGALHQVRWDTRLDIDAAVIRPAQFLERDIGQCLAHWNDAPERTQAEVVAKLREAAAKASGEQP